MTWGEVDWESATWTVPMQRTKTAREHRVPLSSAAMKVLEEAWGYSSGEQDALIFSAPRSGGQLSDMTLLAVLRRLKVPAVPHGFRSSFRSWCAEGEADWATAEASLGHSVGSTVERSYQRSDLLEQRRGLMERWGAFCAGGSQRRFAEGGRTPEPMMLEIR